MKKKILTLTLAFSAGLLAVTEAQAQNGKAFYKTPYKSRNSGSFDRSASLLSFGIGFPNNSGTGFDYWGGNEKRLGIGPGYIKYEHGITDEIGIGGYVAGAAARYKYGPDRRYTDHIFSVSIGAMGYYHFNKLIPVRKLDVYAGAGVGFRNISYSYDDDYNGKFSDDRSDFDVMPLFKVGARYYFTRMFGVYAEGGYDNMSDVNLGITLRF
ncbi:porin family protein [Taibaiella helva]|uniref:hypothetical protein n=1 Tax=Taibaiella helva TaxID=2301235 RepID=UPI000E579713|nr:hypothetical protein [Taibaiella helva]